MAFEKVHKAQGRASKMDVPAIHLSKTTSTFNLKFCEALELNVVGTKLGVDLLYDKVDNKFAFRIGKDNLDQYDTIIQFNKSHQCQIYLRGMLKSLGFAMTKTVPRALKYDEDSELWIFSIPDKHRIDAQAEAEKSSLDKEKSGIIKKSKRIKDGRGTSIHKKKLRSKA
jgi:hypothetical protein